MIIYICTLKTSYAYISGFPIQRQLHFSDNRKIRAYLNAGQLHAPRFQPFLLFQRGDPLHRRIDYLPQIEADRPADKCAEQEERAVITAASPRQKVLFLLELHGISPPVQINMSSHRGTSPL